MTRTTVGLVAGILILLFLAVTLGPAACQRIRSQGEQSKLDRGEAGAFQNSATDAIQTQSKANQREQASEDVGRANEKEIRDAQAKGDDAAVTAAGFRGLCKRASFRATESGKLRCAHTP
jgi:hypothetical protein